MSPQVNHHHAPMALPSVQKCKALPGGQMKVNAWAGIYVALLTSGQEMGQLMLPA